MILFFAPPVQAAVPVVSPSPSPSVSPSVSAYSSFVIKKKDYNAPPPRLLTWTRLRRLFSKDIHQKITLTQSLSNGLLLRTQYGINQPRQVRAYLTAHGAELVQLKTYTARLTKEDTQTSDLFNIILADSATQVAAIDKITPLGSSAVQKELRDTRQALLYQCVLLLESPLLTDDDREGKLVSFINEDAAWEPEREQQVAKKLALQKELQAMTTNNAIKVSLDDLAERLTSMKIDSDNPNEGSKLVFSLDNKGQGSQSTSFSMSSQSNAATNTVTMAITVEGDKLKNSSHFGVNKGAIIQVTFQNNDASPRSIKFSNGIASDPSSSGEKVITPAFRVGEDITYEIPGENMHGSITVF